MQATGRYSRPRTGARRSLRALAVWLYFRFHLSFRDVQDLLAERAIIVNHESIRRWCAKFGAATRLGCVDDEDEPATSGIWTGYC
jgi:transposase-like protein